MPQTVMEQFQKDKVAVKAVGAQVANKAKLLIYAVQALQQELQWCILQIRIREYDEKRVCLSREVSEETYYDIILRRQTSVALLLW